MYSLGALSKKVKKNLGERCQRLSLHSVKKRANQINKGSLAQLVQSICLTSRGSAVRTRQLPLRYQVVMI